MSWERSHLIGPDFSCVDDSGIWGHGGEDDENKDGNANQWVALAVVQTYNPRRKVPCRSISIPELEQCLSKASFSAAQKSASIHMPRIGNQNGSDRSE
ncbi:putative Macro domain-containing protein [Helianthus debilis subsp. tardiflorus]